MRAKSILAVIVACAGASAAFAANTLSVNGTAALNGTSNGLEIEMDSTASNSVFVQSNEPNGEAQMTVIWRMKIQDLPSTSINPVDLRHFRFMTWNEGDGGAARKVFFLQRQPNGNWRLAVWSWNTGTAAWQFAGGTFIGTNGSTADVHVKCSWTQATTGATGQMLCYTAEGTAAFPGTPQLNTTNLTDDGTLIGSVRFGFLDFDGYPILGNGSLYLDEYESYRQ
jgi:hypothetical protein